MPEKNQNSPKPDPETQRHSGQDPEDREIHDQEKERIREKTLDKTLADSFPTSDPPSSIPDPCDDDRAA